MNQVCVSDSVLIPIVGFTIVLLLNYFIDIFMDFTNPTNKKLRITSKIVVDLIILIICSRLV